MTSEIEKYRVMVQPYEYQGITYEVKVGISGNQQTLHIRIPGERENLIICFGDTQEKIKELLGVAQSLLIKKP